MTTMLATIPGRPFAASGPPEQPEIVGIARIAVAPVSKSASSP